MNHQITKISLICLIVFFSFHCILSASILTPGLTKAVEQGSQDSLITVVVILDNNNQDSQLQSLQQPLIKRSERIKSTISRLKSFRTPEQDDIYTYLESNSRKIHGHWVIPAYTVELTVKQIDELSRFSGISQIVENVPLHFESPVKIEPAPMSTSTAISDHLNLMNVPALWNRGLKGQGTLVCSFDTGVDSEHPALSSKWRGNSASLGATWYSKVSPNVNPYDVTGHGTHTMGIMVGSMPSDSFGVAPEAEWITAGVIDQGRSLSMTISDIIDAFEWALNPDGDTSTTDDVPDVILNSWGIPKGLFYPCDDTFWGVIDNVEAAGIVTIFAAGNEGPEPMSLRSPADRASSALNAFSVGAVDLNLTVADFSSRGPSSCDPLQIKPEVVAPGVNIRSSAKGGGFTYMSGTSMAAPYIAGVVALLRQYNPDATVSQIKNAFIQAAIDLGEGGEDNAYGNGFVNVENILDYILLPQAPEYQIESTGIIGSPFALPGENFQLSITLLNPIGNVLSATGTIVPVNKSGVVLLNDQADFFFGNGGTMAQNVVPFEINFDSSFYHGQELEFILVVSDSETEEPDTLQFTLMAGVLPAGVIATHSNSRLDVTVSDFGQFGCAPGSYYNILGDGFKFNGSSNVLYEAGIMIGRSSVQLSTSIRGDNGSFKPSDFIPVSALSEEEYNPDGGVTRMAQLAGQNSDVPIPIDIVQRTTHYVNSGEEGFFIVSYEIQNNTIETITGLHFGLLHDFDMSASDRIAFDETVKLLYQTDNNGMYVGIIGLRDVFSYKTLENVNGKSGYTNSELYRYLSDTSTAIDESTSGDMMFISSTERFNLAPYQKKKITFAYVCGNSVNELYDNAMAAKEKIDIATDIDDSFIGNLPNNFKLNQNYPNPFNPTTTISFQLMSKAEVSLEVFNILGRSVKTIFSGELDAGEHQFVWDATDDANRPVASGMYFTD